MIDAVDIYVFHVFLFDLIVLEDVMEVENLILGFDTDDCCRYCIFCEILVDDYRSILV